MAHGCKVAQWRSGLAAGAHRPKGPPARASGGPLRPGAHARGIFISASASARPGGGRAARATFSGRRPSPAVARDPLGDFLHPAQSSRAERERFFTSFDRRWQIVSRGARVIVAKAASPSISSGREYTSRDPPPLVSVSFGVPSRSPARAAFMFSVYILGARSALNGLRDVQFLARSALNGLHGLQLGARSALNSCQCLQLGARSSLNGFRYVQFGARSSLGGLTIFPGRRSKRAERFAACTVRRAKGAKRFTVSAPLRRARLAMDTNL